MKVLHYVGTFSHLSETFIYEMLGALKRSGCCQQEVLCHTRINADTRPFDPVHECPMGHSLIRRLRWKFKLGKWHFPDNPSFLRHYQEYAPDLVHAHFGSNGVRAVDFLRKQDPERPLLIHCHGTDVLSLPYMDPSYRKQLLAMAQLPNVTLLSNTEFLKEQMVQLGITPEKIVIVRNAVSHGFLDALPKEGRAPRGDAVAFRLLSVGRLIRWKGHAYLLRALARLNEAKPGAVRLSVIGAGDELSKLQALADELGIRGQVDFKGAVSHAEVADAMATHDLYVQPSIIDPETRQCESFGMTVLEAIAGGLPVIITNTGGMPELIGEASRWARVVPQADPEAMAAAIRAAMEATQKGGDNRAYALGRLDAYSQERQVSTLLDLYGRCIGQSPQAVIR